MADDFDLFGDPVAANHGRRGRPAHVPTRENTSKVNAMLVMGWSNDRICATLGVNWKTLKKHYFPLLERRLVARDKFDLRRFALLNEQAAKGNVGAMRELDKFLERNDRMQIEREFSAPAATEQRQERLGKKVIAEQRALDADADLMAELEREAQSEPTIQ